MDDSTEQPEVRALELNLTRNRETGERRVIANMSLPVAQDLIRDLERGGDQLTSNGRAVAALTRQLLTADGLAPPDVGRTEAND